MDPNIAFILLAIGALALYAEFNHPGSRLAGTVGIVFILLAALRPQTSCLSVTLLC
jgi:membrane-bound ClpP family serine protease